MTTMSDLMKKYDIPAPRYTSYPTVPYWENNPTSEQWIQALTQAYGDEKATWSLYMHIPYCESLCTFCGCNTTITKDHTKEEHYVNLLLKEWDLYVQKVPQILNRPLEELHLGGGTPTFLSPESLTKLLRPVLEKVKKHSQSVECSIEIDPRRTTAQHLSSLRELGFKRVSMGVQDFDPEVQRLVNRVQPFEITSSLTQEARRLGYTSVNYDLIYGLPKQTLETIESTMRLTTELKPDRIALYSYAHVPWIKPAQRLFTDADLPTGESKRQLYERSREILASAGYIEIGMDHFALPHDSLNISNQKKTLHRNFMGYTHRRTSILLGLGVSAISETPSCFHQNEKVLPVYDRLVNQSNIPTFRGHLLTDDDRQAREQILSLMTNGKAIIQNNQVEDLRSFLAPMIEDGLVNITESTVSITRLGKAFLRNACMAFDRRLRAKAPATKLFSQAL